MRGVAHTFTDPEGLDLPESPQALAHSPAPKAASSKALHAAAPRSQKASSVLFSVADFETPRPIPRKLSLIHENEDGRAGRAVSHLVGDLPIAEPPASAKKGRRGDFSEREPAQNNQVDSPAVVSMKSKEKPATVKEPEISASNKKGALLRDLSSEWLAFFSPDTAQDTTEAKSMHPVTPVPAATPMLAQRSSPFVTRDEIAPAADAAVIITMAKKLSSPPALPPSTTAPIRKTPTRPRVKAADPDLHDIVNAVW